MKYTLHYNENGITLTQGSGISLVYQDSFNSKDTDVERFVEFLRTVTDHFGPQTNRYSKQRISINIVEGDKYADTRKED